MATAVYLVFIMCCSSVSVLDTKEITDNAVYSRVVVDYEEEGSSEINNIHTIEINDFQNSEMTIKPTIPNGTVIGLETIGAQAQSAVEDGSTVIAGINCDMFAMEQLGDLIAGIPMNATIIDGVLYTSAHNVGSTHRLPVFAVKSDKTPFIGTLQIEGSIKLITLDNTVEYSSYQLNKNFSLNGIAVFTSRINEDSTIRFYDIEENSAYGVNSDTLKYYIISGIEDAANIRAGVTYRGTVSNVITESLEVKIPDGCIAIVESQNIIKSLSVGDEVELIYNINEVIDGKKNVGSLNDIEQCVGAYNWIVKDGVVQTEEIYAEEAFPPLNYIVTTRTAKTGIGIKADGTVIAATVDKTYVNPLSSGMTMEEWGEYFASQGAVNAVNFDGGGSTEMIVINSDGALDTVNSPTDGPSREISTGLLFISDNGEFRGYDSEELDSFTVVIIVILACMTVGYAVFAVVNYKVKKKNKK